MSINRDHIDNERSNRHNLRGIDLVERGWLDEAINEFKNAIKSAPHSADGYDNLASAYADKGELLNALFSYTKALELEPDSSIALYNLGCFLSYHGHRLATRCFKLSYQNDPDMFEARFNYGFCLAQEDKHEKAIHHFQTILIEHEDQDTRFHLALSFIALEKYAQAIKELLQVVKVDKEHQQAWHHLGCSFEQQGFLEEAANALTKAVNLNAKDVEAHLSLALILLNLKRKKEAKSLFKRAFLLDQKRTQEFLNAENLNEDITLAPIITK
jgi:tetratricopeptide (TPR) repeat protein